MSDDGRFIELREAEVGRLGALLLHELFFYGHVDDNECDWIHVADSAFYTCAFGLTTNAWIDAEGHLAGRWVREHYGQAQHVYGRKVPVPEHEDGHWRWSWQREPGRGAFPVTRFLADWLVDNRRRRRRVRRAFERRARQMHPDAEVGIVWGETNAEGWKARVTLPGLEGKVELNLSDRMAMVERRDLETYCERYKS